MNDSRRLLLLSALSWLAGTASIALAPTLISAAVHTSSAAETLRAVTTAQPSQMAQLHITTRRPS